MFAEAISASGVLLHVPVLGSGCERELRTRSCEERTRPGGAFVGRAITGQVRISIHVQDKIVQVIILTHVTCQGLIHTRVDVAHEPVQRFIAVGSPLSYSDLDERITIALSRSHRASRAA